METEGEGAEQPGDLRRKIIRGAIGLGLVVAVAVGIFALLPGLSGVRSAIAGASGWWILAAVGIQVVALAGAVVFVQAVFEELPRRLSWWQGWGMQGANAVLPTAGSTGVSFYSVHAVGWKTYRFAERTAVMIIAPAVPNLLVIIVIGVGMGLGVFPGPSDWWLTWLPAGIMIVVIVVAVALAVWAKKLAQRIKHKRIAQGITVVATGVTGTVAILRRRSWRVLGTFVDLFGSIFVLWACLIAVNDHLPFSIVAMGYLIGQFAQAIPVPGGVGTIDAGVTGALVAYGAPGTTTTAGEVISHGISLIIPILTGLIAAVFLPRAVAWARAHQGVPDDDAPPAQAQAAT